MSLGKVILVGAGPGDPELLTLKADKAIQQADVIVYDYLVSDEIIARFPSQAKTIYVGKRHGNHSASQTDINQILIDHALLGQRVVSQKNVNTATVTIDAKNLKKGIYVFRLLDNSNEINTKKFNKN